MRATIYIQRSRGKRTKKPQCVTGFLDKGGDYDMLVMISDGSAYRLHRPRIETVGADGMLLSGHEVTGQDVNYYQEWWCVFGGKEDERDN